MVSAFEIVFCEGYNFVRRANDLGGLLTGRDSDWGIVIAADTDRGGC